MAIDKIIVYAPLREEWSGTASFKIASNLRFFAVLERSDAPLYLLVIEILSKITLNNKILVNILGVINLEKGPKKGN